MSWAGLGWAGKFSSAFPAVLLTHMADGSTGRGESSRVVSLPWGSLAGIVALVGQDLVPYRVSSCRLAVNLPLFQPASWQCASLI